MFVDGSDPISQTVYEFHGRLRHRCCNCFPVCKKIAWNLGDTMMEALYQETNEKTATLKEWGYRVVEMWECPWHTQINANFHISDYIQTQQGTTSKSSWCFLRWPNSGDVPIPCFWKHFGGRNPLRECDFRVPLGQLIRDLPTTPHIRWIHQQSLCSLLPALIPVNNARSQSEVRNELSNIPDKSDEDANVAFDEAD